jgi:molybdopterin/thiamine biosynthesis adenylyltransferase
VNEPLSFLARKRVEALDLVAEWVAGTAPGARRLDTAGLLAIGRDAGWDGWRLPLEGIEGGALNLLLDADFPYSIPRFALGDRPDLLKAPHVEDEALLCVSGTDARADTLDPVAVVAFSYGEAVSLVAEDESGGNRDDFRIDFDAYWNRDATSSFRILSWLRPQEKSRMVAAWHGDQFYFLGDSAAECRQWMNNRYGSDEERSLKDAAVIWVQNLPEPDAYPKNAAAARKLVIELSRDGLTVFDRLMSVMTDRACVVLMGKTLTGDVAQAAILIEDPGWNAEATPAPRQAVTRGFRPGRVPANILAVRRQANRAAVEKVDAWRSRVRTDEGEELASKRVAVIGCGSLGAGVARLLLQSGLGNAILVDPETFGWENVSRHELGADSVCQKKASELVAKFKPMYPHAGELKAEPITWQALLRREPDALREVDLILSLTGDWNSESALNDLQRSGAGQVTAPIVYGWLEQQAAAAHALAIGSSGACLRCGFGATGIVDVPATKWPRQRPGACGGATSIYGAVELAPAQALVASLAVDLLLGRAAAPVRRSWLAPASTLEHGGGYWHPKWIEAYGNPSRGGHLTATPWLEGPDCPCVHRPSTCSSPAWEAALVS